MARFSKRYSRFPLGHKIHSGQGLPKCIVRHRFFSLVARRISPCRVCRQGNKSILDFTTYGIARVGMKQITGPYSARLIQQFMFTGNIAYSSEVDQPAPFHSGLSCRNGTLFLSVPRLSRSGMVSVYDLQGKKIGSWKVPATVGKGALARFPLHTRHSNGPGKGLYLVKVRFGKETASNVIPVWD
jgi:hypothetical protein